MLGIALLNTIVVHNSVLSIVVIIGIVSIGSMPMGFTPPRYHVRYYLGAET
jgi:hypothetical protein